MSEPRQLVVVSGNSGGGKSVALRALEDIGYYCVDNLPVTLLSAFVDGLSPQQRKVAVSIDIRNLPTNPSQVAAVLTTLDDSVQVTVLYLEANEETLVKRYSETRRIHPLSLVEDSRSLQQAIVEEKRLLSALKEQADLVIDSSKLSIHELSEMVRKRILGRDGQELVMVFQSFGFKHGLPSDVDYVFDVRFLPNPHWKPELRPLTGLDKPIQDYLFGFEDVVELKGQIQAFIERWLPSLEKNNRSYLTVAIGCTGGKHRSVFLTQQIGEYFLKQGQHVLIRHNELEKGQ
ncbi:RNase adaptor protein RapZ [Vibrio breoganii]|uniref:RNase adaptor protein RapZ n=1 Tax=Vibrio breoganii TaxID=553239 RepID=A0AAP8MTV7_9VIBR|nr:RNase adapter RapZ [Vibrio breoganii]MDN3717313.1 RNase adapter RapZ [Vibrio breoganii]OEF86077.1 RNase adaptor protein RapZ [Vibrio breoganii 1C10]PMG31301.1 RNase adaptor protein RapZ [Vibrio breoganii]PMG79748.1 RNase adaptor protein RapZ [Vibrio breoganii]PMG85108.1 RNase adaptor protein RapZ [Vibrio breoganii]